MGRAYPGGKTWRAVKMLKKLGGKWRLLHWYGAYCSIPTYEGQCGRLLEWDTREEAEAYAEANGLSLYRP